MFNTMLGMAILLEVRDDKKIEIMSNDFEILTNSLPITSHCHCIIILNFRL